MHIKYTIKLLVIATLLGFLSGCGEQDSKNNSPSQVAAKVNDKEITVHQVNQILKTIPNTNNQNFQQVADQILDKLINQEVLLQQAKTLKLDRDPEVLSAIELAKRKVLIDAYASKVLQGTSAPEEAKIKQYFDNNPKFFGNRKVFTYTQFLVKTEGENANNLIAFIKEKDDINALRAELDSLKSTYKINYQTISSEKLSKPLLEPIYSLKTNDIGYLKMDDGLMILQLNKVNDEPVNYQTAKPAITQHLMKEARAKETGKLMNNLREQAQIEYVGDFSAVKSEATEK